MIYDTKRAVLTLVNSEPCKGYRDTVLAIGRYKAALDALAPTFAERAAHPKYAQYQAEIQKQRKKMRSFRTQTYYFDVYVKQYRHEVVEFHNCAHMPMGPLSREELKKMLKEVTDRAIRKCRERLSGMTHGGVFAGYNVEYMGLAPAVVFVKPGEVLRIHVAKNLRALYDDKRPVEPRKYIGIELEFCAPIKENEFAIRLFRSGIHKFAQLKKDGSLRPLDGETGYELAILLEESNYKKRLKQITVLLASVGAVANNRRAGLHVHLDMRKRNKDIVYHNLVACQYALLSVVDPKRYNNEFCQVVRSRKFPTEFTGERQERYKTINAAAFYKYKTLEVRMHEGSVDYAQIMNWVDLLVRVANYSKKMSSGATKVTQLGKLIKLNPKTTKYLQERSCYWQINDQDGIRHIREDMRRANHRAHRAVDEPEQPTTAEGRYIISPSFDATFAPEEPRSTDVLRDAVRRISSALNAELTVPTPGVTLRSEEEQ